MSKFCLSVPSSFVKSLKPVTIEILITNDARSASIDGESVDGFENQLSGSSPNTRSWPGGSIEHQTSGTLVETEDLVGYSRKAVILNQPVAGLYRAQNWHAFLLGWEYLKDTIAIQETRYSRSSRSQSNMGRLRMGQHYDLGGAKIAACLVSREWESIDELTLEESFSSSGVREQVAGRGWVDSHQTSEYFVVEDLNIGDPITWEHMFQEVDSWRGYHAQFGWAGIGVSSGRLFVPKERPRNSKDEEGLTWANPAVEWLLPVRNVISGSKWPHFYTGLQGHFPKEVFPNLAPSTEDVSKIIASGKATEEKSGDTYSKTAFHPWLNEYAGSSIRFSATGRELRTLHDSENKIVAYVVSRSWNAAIYIYPPNKTGRRQATSWACGGVDWRQNRNLFEDGNPEYTMILHQGEWQGRLREALRARGVFCSAD